MTLGVLDANINGESLALISVIDGPRFSQFVVRADNDGAV